MRIRKHANISLSPSLRTRTTLHPHVCQLNRSPWDVMPFPLQSDGQPHPNQYQREEREEEEEEEEEAVMGMGNGVSSIAAAADGSEEREFSKEGRGEKKKKRGVASEREMIPSKGKTCNKEEDEGQSQLDACPKVGEKDVVGGRRGRKNQGRAFSSKSDYYYYYSGFGPLWGRKRGGTQLLGVHAPPIPSPSSPSSSPLPSSSDHDDHDHDHDHDRRMKRVRKRVKARSLKSLL
ncbi:uncharacterized protein LOC131231540 [Magnolia sinica]|uniref:uncharacterized protein LOC131231540 n=1 Tax=Magnolia sinica TaxID=86752 RepID=UPI0026591DA5|nr:uncharacterized protein LOC131231540 [Magnolia sinica]